MFKVQIPNSSHQDPGTPINIHSNILSRPICHSQQCTMTKKDLNTNTHTLCILYTLLWQHVST